FLKYVMTPVFFFQVEDSIRDRNVTGVQTCALPIFRFSNLPYYTFLTWITVRCRYPLPRFLANNLLVFHPQIQSHRKQNRVVCEYHVLSRKLLFYRKIPLLL